MIKALSHFQSISLKEMDQVKLMNRTDTKFIFNVDRLENIFGELLDKYYILEINNSQILDYRSQYFDTENFNLYLNHQNSKLNRFKIRQRKYLVSDLSFFEIKYKSNKGRTIKKRIKIKDLSESLDQNLKKYLEDNTPYSADEFKASIINNFSRITLVHKTNKERITIDQNLNYQYANKNIDLAFLAIAEVKREGFAKSDFIDILKKHRIYPQSMSKYCIGTLLLNRHLKYNRFKEKLLTLNKIANNDSYNLVLDRH
jgi:PIN domain nuclease of toxin-antitoxin system